jgi:large subunit ribosomal protein L30
MMAKLTVTQKRSAIKTNPHQRGTLKALGLRKTGDSVEREDSPQLRGQLDVVSHLVEVKEA